MKLGTNVILFEIGTKVGGALCYRLGSLRPPPPPLPPELRKTITEPHHRTAVGIRCPLTALRARSLQLTQTCPAVCIN